MQTSEVLNRAADLIEERGWTNGGGWAEGSNTTPLCLEGGIMAASGLVATDIYGSFNPETAWAGCPAHQAVVDYLGYARRLYHWNDKKGRTAEQVIEVLRAAAVIEAAKENSDTREPVTA